MVAEGRQDAILRQLELQGSLRVTRFAQQHRVSAMTVRRDLEQLEREQLLVRVHGGAISLGVASARGAAPLAERSLRRPVATIGIVAPSASYYYPEVIRGAVRAARELNARLVLGVTNYSTSEELRQAERMLRGGIDALVITPSATIQEGSALHLALLVASIPVIVLERSITDGHVDTSPLGSVRTDHAHGADLAVRHLQELGHERIALASRPSASAPWIEAGWSRAVTRAGGMTDGMIHALAHPSDVDADLAGGIEDFLDACLDLKATAALVHTDADAVALVDAAAERGIRVPDLFSVIAYDDEIAALARVPITAASPPKWDLGHRAVRMAFERLRSADSGTVERATLLPTLVVRESTAALRV